MPKQQLLVIAVKQLRHTLLTGKPLTAFHTKGIVERHTWPSALG